MAHIVALPWYHRPDWPVLHAVFADREAVSPCYDQWKARAIARELRWREDGYTVRRIEVRPEAFIAWCQRNNRKPDHAARRAYADELLAQQRLGNAGATAAAGDQHA